MSLNTYIGEHTNEMDSKGRVVLPSSFRKVPDELRDAPVFLSPNPLDGCVDAYPEPVWNAYIDRIETDETLEMGEADELIADLFADAVKTRVDKQNRLILHEMRAGLKIEEANGNVPLVFVGAGSYYRIYTADAYETVRAERARRKLERMKKLKSGPNRRLRIDLPDVSSGDDDAA